MSGWVRRISALGVAILVFSTVVGAAKAQSAPDAPLPPVFSAVDANGVDLSTGQISLSTTQASVGQPGEGGLSQVYTGEFGRDNLFGSIDTATEGSNLIYRVSIGASSVKFVKSPSAPTPTFSAGVGAAGQTLVYNGQANTYLSARPWRPAPGARMK